MLVACMPTFGAVDVSGSKFAEAEKRIQKRIHKLEKLNFRKQLKSYLSDSSQA